MAWNEPGKNRNPWGNRPDRGSADLDDALRNFQRRLARLFGGGQGGNGDGDADGVLDGYGRWYYGNTAQTAASDREPDGSTLLQEFTNGSDPNDGDTDDDGVLDGADPEPQDRLVQ